MSTVDLYDILDVDPNCSQKDIISGYKKLVKKYHPDKHRGDADLFELINMAFDTLSKPQKRLEYDNLQKVTQDSNKKLYQRKQEFKDFVKAQHTSVVKKTDDEAQKDFKDQSRIMDDNIGYQRSQACVCISDQEADELIEERKLTRNQDDIEFQHDDIFEGSKFKQDVFNEAWEKVHGKPTDLIIKTDKPNAWNNDSVNNVKNNLYGSCDKDYSEIFGDNDASLSQNITSQHALTKEEVKQMQGNKDTYGHNHDNNEQKMKELMEQRKQERKSFNINDFNTDPNMDGFGILNQVGVTVDTLHIENKDTIDKHYEYLLENRKKNSQ